MKNLKFGMVLNKSVYETDPNAYTFGLNLMRNNSEIETELISEIGNQLAITLPSGHKLIGHTNLYNKEIVLFSLKESTNEFNIYLQNDKELQLIASLDCFNYSTKHPIKGEFKLHNSCERIVYFYDGVEPDRFINIDNIDVHKLGSNFVCDSFLLTPAFEIPVIRFKSIDNFGGKLKSGSYELFVRYVDKMNNVTDWIIPEDDIYIFKESSKIYDKQLGSDEVTSKSITYYVDTADSSYKYLEVAVAINKSECYVYDRYPVNIKNITISDPYQKPTISYSSLIAVTAKYKNSQAMIQQDNRLIRANVKEDKIDWGYVQRMYVNNIKTFYQTSQADSDKNPVYQNQKSLMRDEVYALAIVYVKKDGSISPALHIPGRRLNWDPYGSQYIPASEPNPWHNRQNAGTTWEGDIFSPNSDSQHITGNYQAWQLWNTAIRWESALGIPGYHQVMNHNNEPILYPEDKDCEGNLIYPNIDGVMEPIRHHRMPDTTLEPHFENGIIKPLNLLFTNVDLPVEYPDIVGYYFCHSDRSFGKTILDKGIVSSIVERQYNDYVAETDISKSEFKPVTMLHQSLQTSKDNQRPKSYTIQTSNSVNVSGSGGDQRFCFIPACSENIAYSLNMNEEVTLPARMSPQFVGYDSPKSKFTQSVENSTFMKWELELITKDNNSKIVYDNRRKHKSRESDKFIKTQTFLKLDDVNRPSLTSRPVLDSTYIKADLNYANVNSEFNFVNKTQQEIGVIKLIENEENQAYLYDKNLGPSNLSSAACFPIPNNYTAANQSWIDKNLDPYEDNPWKMSYNYVSLKNYIPDLHSNLSTIKYEVNSEYNTPVLFGDIWISKFSFRKTFYGYVPHAGVWNNEVNASTPTNLKIFADNKEKESYDSTGNYTDLGTSYNAGWESVLIEAFYETDINASLRSEGDLVYYKSNNISEENTNDFVSSAPVYFQKFYPSFYGNAKDFLALEINANSIGRLTDNGEWVYFELFPNYYKLEDYYNNRRKYMFTGLESKSCSSCDNEYSNRIVWSEKSFNEIDTYRKFLVNNFIDLNSTAITNLFEINNQLLVLTKESLFGLPKTNQTIQLDNGTVNIGTGEYLSNPPQRLNNLFYSYGGNSGRFNLLPTEFGVFYVDTTQSKIYLFSDKLKEISEPINLFCNENLKFHLPYYNDNHTYKYGLGITTALDYQNKRFILHKKDFKPLFKIVTEPEANSLIFVDDKWYYVNNRTDLVEAEFTNPNYFENKSFTLSYDLKTGVWISFHSYQPNYMYYNDRIFFSTYDQRKIYSHDGNENREFYGSVYPFIIEYLNYISDKAIKCDNINYITRKQDFDKIWVYNESQSGIYNLIKRTNPYQTYTWSNTDKIISTHDNITRVTGLKNQVDNLTEPFYTKDWVDISNQYNIQGQGYIDKVPNITVHNFNRNLYEVEDLKDQYQKVRLYFRNKGEIRLQILDTNLTQSIR